MLSESEKPGVGEWVLAVDIEMSGAVRRGVGIAQKSHGDVIGIGAVLARLLTDGTRKIVETLFLPMYFPEEDARGWKTLWEKRCWDEMWSKYPEQLAGLVYKGPLTLKQCERDAIEKFAQFQIACEKAATDAKARLRIVSDNVSYDIGTMDAMRRDLTGHAPMVWRLLDAMYNGGPKCVGSMAVGALAVIESTWIPASGDAFDKMWGNDKLNHLYNVPPVFVEIDGETVEARNTHHPVCDAANIAGNYLTILGIQHEVYSLDHTKLLPRPAKRRKAAQ